MTIPPPLPPNSSLTTVPHTIPSCKMTDFPSTSSDTNCHATDIVPDIPVPSIITNSPSPSSHSSSPPCSAASQPSSTSTTHTHSQSTTELEPPSNPQEIPLNPAEESEKLSSPVLTESCTDYGKAPRSAENTPTAEIGKTYKNAKITNLSAGSISSSGISSSDVCNNKAANDNNNSAHSLHEIKELQDHAAKEYLQIARSLARARASRITSIINAMRKNEHRRFAMFDKVYKAQDGWFEECKAKSTKHRDYENYRIRKATAGEAGNIWLQFYDAKHRLQEKLISEVNEKIAKLFYEYTRSKTTRLSQPMASQIERYHNVALDIGPLPGVNTLTDDQIEADLDQMNPNRVQDDPSPSVSTSEVYDLNSLVEFSAVSLAQINSTEVMQASIAASHTSVPQPCDSHEPQTATSVKSPSNVHQSSFSTSSKPFAINSLLTQDTNTQPTPTESSSSKSTLIMFEYDQSRPSEQASTFVQDAKRTGDLDLASGPYKRLKTNFSEPALPPISNKVPTLPPIPPIMSQEQQQREVAQALQEREEWLMRREQDEWRAKEYEQRREYELEVQRRQGQGGDRIPQYDQYQGPMNPDNYPPSSVPPNYADYPGSQGGPRPPYDYPSQQQQPQSQYNNYPQYPYLAIQPQSMKQEPFYPPPPPQQQQQQPQQQPPSQSYSSYPPALPPLDYRYDNMPRQSAFQYPQAPPPPPPSYNYTSQYTR